MGSKRRHYERNVSETQAGCPNGKTYIPYNLQDHVIEWAHTSPTSGHPGITRTLSIISGKYWWPRMTGYVKTAVQLCAVCATTKSSRQLPLGKLMPLPTPTRPWSHIAVDFVMDLPVSQGYMVIMVVVDRISKGCRPILFCSLPSVLQVAESLLHHVFRCYGILENILLDRDPQFSGYELGVTIQQNVLQDTGYSWHQAAIQKPRGKLSTWFKSLADCSGNTVAVDNTSGFVTSYGQIMPKPQYATPPQV